jgi:hypothetical protein
MVEINWFTILVGTPAGERLLVGRRLRPEDLKKKWSGEMWSGFY